MTAQVQAADLFRVGEWFRESGIIKCVSGIDHDGTIWAREFTVTEGCLLECMNSCRSGPTVQYKMERIDKSVQYGYCHHCDHMAMFVV